MAGDCCLVVSNQLKYSGGRSKGVKAYLVEYPWIVERLVTRTFRCRVVSVIEVVQAILFRISIREVEYVCCHVG